MATSKPSPFPLSKGRVWRQRSSRAEVRRLQAAPSMPTRSAKWATAPPTAATRRSSRDRCRIVRECSRVTAVRHFHVTGFHAFEAIIQAVHAELDSLESGANATVAIATALVFGLVTLRADNGLRGAHFLEYKRLGGLSQAGIPFTKREAKPALMKPPQVGAPITSSSWYGSTARFYFSHTGVAGTKRPNRFSVAAGT